MNAHELIGSAIGMLAGAALSWFVVLPFLRRHER